MDSFIRKKIFILFSSLFYLKKGILWPFSSFSLMAKEIFMYSVQHANKKRRKNDACKKREYIRIQYDRPFVYPLNILTIYSEYISSSFSLLFFFPFQFNSLRDKEPKKNTSTSSPFKLSIHICK